MYLCFLVIDKQQDWENQKVPCLLFKNVLQTWPSDRQIIFLFSTWALPWTMFWIMEFPEAEWLLTQNVTQKLPSYAWFI